jgi:predicted transcriptional regulator
MTLRRGLFRSSAEKGSPTISTAQLALLTELEEGPVSSMDLVSKLDQGIGKIHSRFAPLRTKGLVNFSEGVFALTPKGCEILDECSVK